MVMEKRCLARKLSFIGGLAFLVGKFVMKSFKVGPFLILGVVNSRLKYSRIMTYQVNLIVIGN